MRSQSSTKFLSAILAPSFLLAQLGWAQSSSSTQSTPAPVPAAQEQQDNRPTQQPQAAKPPAAGTTINPSEGPLQPITTYPDAAGQQGSPDQAQSTTPNAPQPKTQQTEPQGAATAERVPVAGGAAAKPAGVAIAPAKQHRTRSLLIKFGAVAAAGVAAGTIYALSRGTSSTPPGASGPGAVPK